VKGGCRMENNLEKDIERIMNNYGNVLFRICLIMLGNPYDAEDVIQETLIKYLQKSSEFKGKEHEKAWLIRVASNKCKDILRFRTRHITVDIQSIQESVQDSTGNGILEALMRLPEKFKIVLLLYYVEQYKTEEIAKILGKSASAVKMRLQKGRRLLKEIYQKEYM